jgi:TPR repeat protein
MASWDRRYRLLSAALLGAALACELAVLTANTPASAQERPLHPNSPASVLNDPAVQRCRLLAGRRADPKLDSMSTGVERAAAMFELEPVFDAVAACRAALARYPNEPKVIIAESNASDYLSTMMLGLKFPDSDEQAFALVLQVGNAALSSANRPSNDAMFRQMEGFYLGSAYEYGVGTKPDRAAAMKWYAFAADAGDAISKRELARLQGAKP